jgi:exonuclease III
MKLISWNVRGLGGFEKRREVRQLVREKKPFIVCIQETKLTCFDEVICKSLWGDSNFSFSFQSSVGASGGLLTFWDCTEVEVWSTTSFEHVLLISGRFLRSEEHFVLLNVYAPCEVTRQQALWFNISNKLESFVDQNVCVCGDFNAVRNVEERRSVGSIPRVAGINSLIDLPLRGRSYTWFRGDGRSMSRIDRFLVSESWCSSWPNCFQTASARGLSDHCMLELSVDEQNWGPKPLRMLNCWESFPGYDMFVREKWQCFQVDGWGGYVLKEKFKLIKLALREWHQRHTQNLPAKILSLKDQISALDLKGESDLLLDFEVEELHGLSENLFSLSRVNSSICWQQSRMQWLREGDANSKFFHGIMSNRRKINAIPCFFVDGALIEGVDNVRNAVFSHFSSHFKSSQVDRPSLDGLNFQTLSVREGASLVRPFTMDEVKAAVWEIDNFKCPGPDGVTFGFIKKFWDLLKDDVMRFLVEFHRNGRLAKGINSTFIALIPKVDSPQRLNDFRPISLVGSMYKILAKVLAIRLRVVIGSVISESQSAFIKGRQILDGILVANEVVDEARRQNKELLLFKVDFEKAFDSIDWRYLDAVLLKMGFPTLWRKWIKECIGTASASVLVNGSPTDEFNLERGLRQGDPLSPFLFLLAAEGFNVLMESFLLHNIFTGYKVGASDPVVVSHLQFADDTLILGEKSWANIRAMRAVLLLFEALSGLKVNFSKSQLVGVNVSSSWLAEAALVLNCNVGSLPFVYLGLPIGGNARRLAFWEPVLNRIKSRLSVWNCKHLSLGGRLVLLKSVLSSLPVYALSFFKAPSGIVSSIESI